MQGQFWSVSVLRNFKKMLLPNWMCIDYVKPGWWYDGNQTKQTLVGNHSTLMKKESKNITWLHKQRVSIHLNGIIHLRRTARNSEIPLQADYGGTRQSNPDQIGSHLSGHFIACYTIYPEVDRMSLCNRLCDLLSEVKNEAAHIFEHSAVMKTVLFW